jgi:hypothetical protein
MSSSSPDSDEQTARQQLVSLSKALLALHKTLLDSERVGYEASFGNIPTSGAFLNLVMGDPWFAYLHGLSQFIVQIDETLDAKGVPITGKVVADFVAKARELLTPEQEGLGFGLHYHNAMQRDPDVILAHAGMVKFLTTLDGPKKSE